MEKKLPSVFANKINKAVGNNKDVFYSSKASADDFDVRSDESMADGSGSGSGVHFSSLAGGKLKREYKNINQKINAIFNAPNYIYKADVEITLKSGKVTKKIVGKNTTHLITMENELIPLTDIIDIQRK